MSLDAFSLQVCRFPGNYQEHPRSSGYAIHLAKDVFPATPFLDKVVPYTVTDTPIPMSRNRAVKNAIDSGIDYILMIDSDMDPDLYLGADPVAVPFFQTAWKFLMERRHQEEKYLKSLQESKSGKTLVEIDCDMFYVFPPATIAAPYCGPPPKEYCYVFEWTSRESDQPNPDFKLEMVSREKAAVLSGIQEVAALPTGLILYDARVFRKLITPWYDYEYTDKYHTNKVTTEDVYQTRNASLLSMPQFVAWDCWSGHVKPKTVGKPRVVTPDMVTDSIWNGMKNIRSDQRIKFLVENP